MKLKRVFSSIPFLFAAIFCVADVVIFSIGPNSPTIGASVTGIGAVGWLNASNITSSNNSYATAGLVVDAEQTNYLQGTGYNFTLPAGALVNGIVVEIERSVQDSPGNAPVSDFSVRIVKNGSIVGTDHKKPGNWTTTDTVVTYGSSTDLWGVFWQAADVKSSTFGAAISAQMGNPVSSNTVQVDHMRITVYYIFATVIY